MVVTGAEDGRMRPEALSEEGGLLLEPLVVESDKSTIATSRGGDPLTKPVFVACAPLRLRDPYRPESVASAR
jgi:hypothetical protein